MRYHFQQMRLVCTVGSQTDTEALQELNAYRKQYSHLPYEIVGQRGGRIYLPSNELLLGDKVLFEHLSEDGRDYDGISAYYDSVEEAKACFSLLSQGSAMKYYYIVVHDKYTIFVRKEEQLIQDVERLVRASLQSGHKRSVG